jgi:hypothetical protein
MALFGVRSIQEAIQAIEGAVGITFAAHDSLYLGPYERAVMERSGGREIVFELRENVDPMWRSGDPLRSSLAYGPRGAALFVIERRNAARPCLVWCAHRWRGIEGRDVSWAPAVTRT